MTENIARARKLSLFPGRRSAAIPGLTGEVAAARKRRKLAKEEDKEGS